jgi:protease-4
MKKISVILAAIVFTAVCSPQFHLDFLGKSDIEEVVLIRSAAKEKILVIDVEGTISSLTGTSALAREGDLLSQVYFRLERASFDPLVRAIILRLETPGGEVTASDILYHEIVKFKEKTRRPVVGLMMSVAASGGYYIASACDTIIAHPSTITGSIGVISIFPSVESLFDKIGVRMNIIKSGRMKDEGSPFRSMTEDEKKSFQAIIDEYYQDFLDVILKGRKNALSPEELRLIADGRVYTARQALNLKLIDDIGYFDSALKKALSMAGLGEAKVVAYTYYPKTKTNIYAAGLKQTKVLETGLETWLPTLKSGFYYLWLPESQK